MCDGEKKKRNAVRSTDHGENTIQKESFLLHSILVYFLVTGVTVR